MGESLIYLTFSLERALIQCCTYYTPCMLPSSFFLLAFTLPRTRLSYGYMEKYEIA